MTSPLFRTGPAAAYLREYGGDPTPTTYQFRIAGFFSATSRRHTAQRSSAGLNLNTSDAIPQDSAGGVAIRGGCPGANLASASGPDTLGT